MKESEIMAVAPCDFEKISENMTLEEKRVMSQRLESTAVRAAERAAYLKMRYGFGRGDQGHEDAVKNVNKARRAVRSAFGYNVTPDVSF